MIYRSSWSFVAPHRFFDELRILHLVDFTDGTVFQTFFYTLADIVLIFWRVSQLPEFLKAAYKDRHISYIFKDDQIPSFTSKWILYLQEYMQPVGDLVLSCNTFRMLVYTHCSEGYIFDNFRMQRCPVLCRRLEELSLGTCRPSSPSGYE